MARALSEEIVKKIQGLIDRGTGDIERLHKILNSLQNGDSIDLTDQQYIEGLSLDITESEKNEIPASSDTYSLEPNNETNLNKLPEAKEETVKTPSGNKKKIALAGIVIAVIFFSYIGANVYAVNTLQIKPHQGNQYAISETKLHIEAQACNPSYFPASFHNYEIDAIYQSKVLETASINGSTISPKSSLLLEGTFTIDKEALSQFASLGSNFDPNQARVKTKLDAAIFGIIPFTINKDFTGKEFEDIVKNGPPGGYSC